MPRKSKGFKSRLRAAAKSHSQGKVAEANAAWQSITADRTKLKADKLAKRTEKKAAKVAKKGGA